MSAEGLKCYGESRSFFNGEALYLLTSPGGCPTMLTAVYTSLWGVHGRPRTASRIVWAFLDLFGVDGRIVVP